jgi:hypothetical protein
MKNESVSEELKSLGSTLPPRVGNAGFEVPKDYFDSLPQQVLEKIKEQQKAKVISLRIWYKLSAAAVLVGLIISTAVYYQGQKIPDVKNNPKAWIALSVNKVSDSNLNNFIELSKVENDSTQYAGTLASAKEVSSLVQDVTDKEISSLLEDANSLVETNSKSSN